MTADMQDKASVTYTTLREANIARQQEWDAGNQITLAYRGNELAGEVGEACNIIKKLERERLGIRGSRATREQLAEELADIVICTDLVAMSEGIDLDAAVAAKFNATSEKVGLATRLAAALAQAEQPIGYITPEALKQLRMGIDCQPIHKDDRHGFTVPVYATPPAALSVEKSPAVETPPPVQHMEPPKPTAWLTKIYSNDGVLLDTRLDFVKPVIMSTAKTEFVPLFATTEGSGNG